MAQNEDYSAALVALRKISTHLGNKDAQNIGHGTWMMAGLTPGSTLKQVNDRIRFIKQLVSAHNKAEAHRLDGEEGPSPMSGGSTFKDVGDRGKGRKSGWDKRMTRSAGRDAKMLTAMAQTGDMDLECDRLYYGGDGTLRTVE